MISDHRIQNFAMSILGNVFSERVAKIPDNIHILGYFARIKTVGVSLRGSFFVFGFCSFRLCFRKVNFGQLLPKYVK